MNLEPKAVLKPSHSKRWRDIRRPSNCAKRLECGAFTAALAAACAAIFAAGCAGPIHGDANAGTASPATPSPFYLGADISTLSEVERRGGVYMDGDKPGDALAIFMKHGWTCFRLRIWVDPRNGVNGLDYTTALAKRIKAAGGTFMLDFHYSDWWADPQKQNKPAAWAKLDFDALVIQVESYTAHVIKTLKDAGATPDFVQVGNEITGGTLWPDAQVKVPLSTVKVFGGDVTVIKPPEPYDDAKQWSHLIRVLQAATKGVRSVTQPADNVRVVIHIDCGGDWPVTQWYFDHLTEARLDYDIIGQSYYPNWHGTLENLRDNLRETIHRYHKDVMVVEAAYPSRDVRPSAAAAKNMIWPMTPEGQKQFLADLIRTVKEAPEGRGIGVNYWHPEATYVPNATGRGSGPDANSLFDNRGHPLPALNVLGLQPERAKPQAAASPTGSPQAAAGAAAAPGSVAKFGTPGIELKPFTLDHRKGADSAINLSFLLDPPAGKDGFIRVQNGHLVKPDGKPIRFWGFNLTEWSPGSTEIPSKEDAPMWADTLARFGVNFVRLHFLDLPAPRGMIDSTRDDSQHFDPDQLDKEDFFIAELLKRGIYVDLNLNVGRRFKSGDNVLATQVGKGPLIFDKRLIELQKDYARQLLTHVNPYTQRAYVDEPGVAIVEIVNEDAVYIGWNSNNAYDSELTDLYNAWLKETLSPEKLARIRELAGVTNNQPVPRLKGPAVRNAPKERYYTECDFFTDLQAGFFREMSSFLKDTLKVKCPVIATADHAHSGSGYSLVSDTSLLDIVDGHTYWQHPGERTFKNAPMVNDPLNSTVVELSRTAVAGKPYTVSEVNNPFPNQFAGEGIPILAAYAGFLDWDAVVWYTFELKRDPNWAPYVGDPFDMSLDPMRMPQMAAGALMFVRGDLEAAKKTIERSYSRQQVLDSRLLPGSERPYFTPGFPAATPLLHGSRIRSLAGEPFTPVNVDSTCPYRTDTGQLVWFTNSDQAGLVTIDSPRSQGLVGFVKANGQRVSNLAADVKNEFCAIVVNSLEPKPISSASRLLLTACVRAENTGMQWDARRTRVTQQGRSPTLIEPVTGTITLRNLAPAMKVLAKALDGSGHVIGDPIAAKQTEAGWEIPVGDPVTTWYEVTVER